jgi:hypothetical protein
MSQISSATDLATHLAQLKQQEAANRDTEVRLNTERESVERDLAAAQQKAEDEFGTSDIVKMRELFVQYSNEDREAIALYAESVNGRAALLDDIQKRLTAHRSSQPGKA